MGSGVITPLIIDVVAPGLSTFEIRSGKHYEGGWMDSRAGLVTAPAGNGNGLWSVAFSLQRLHHLEFTMIQGIRQADILFCRPQLQQKRASKFEKYYNVTFAQITLI
jgi:hypothetical protein